jgi:hypothetical protein
MSRNAGGSQTRVLGRTIGPACVTTTSLYNTCKRYSWIVELWFAESADLTNIYITTGIWDKEVLRRCAFFWGKKPHFAKSVLSRGRLDLGYELLVDTNHHLNPQAIEDPFLGLSLFGPLA